MEALDKYIGTHVVVTGNKYITTLTKVIGRNGDHSVNLVGDRNNNPILDTKIYEIEFTDVHVEELLANTILENILEKVDDDG